MAVAAFTESDLELLSLSSCTSNVRHDVTGLLVFDGSRFTQLIEGPLEGVEAVRRRIYADRRHSRIRVALDGPADARQFDGWALMTCWRVRDTPTPDFVNEVKAKLTGVTEASIAAMFIGFARMAV